MEHLTYQHIFSASCPAWGCCPVEHGGYGYGNGRAFSSNARHPIGTKLQFYCYHPYKITSGVSRITCTAAGNWSHDPPTCGGPSEVLDLEFIILTNYKIVLNMDLCMHVYVHKHIHPCTASVIRGNVRTHIGAMPLMLMLTAQFQARVMLLPILLLCCWMV